MNLCIVAPLPLPLDANVIVSVPGVVVIVIPLPAANVNVSVLLSATTLVCPDTATVPNVLLAPPPLTVVNVNAPEPSVVSTCPLVPSEPTSDNAVKLVTPPPLNKLVKSTLPDCPDRLTMFPLSVKSCASASVPDCNLTQAPPCAKYIAPSACECAIAP